MKFTGTNQEWTAVITAAFIYVPLVVVLYFFGGWIQKIPGFELFGLLAPFVVAAIATFYVMEKGKLILQIAELTAILLIDEVFGSKRLVVGPGLRLTSPFEKAEGNIFSLEKRSAKFADVFETDEDEKDEDEENASGAALVEFQIQIEPDVSSLEMVTTFNSLGTDPISVAFGEYGAKAGEAIQQLIASKTIAEVQKNPTRIREEILRAIDGGKNEVEKKTGTKVVSARITTLGPDQATQEVQRLMLRVLKQTKLAWKMVKTAGKGEDGKWLLSFDRAMDKVQTADPASKAASNTIRGGARSFFGGGLGDTTP